MNVNLNYTKGIKAENLAAEYILNKGYRIIETRFKYKHGEIDIIAYDLKLNMIVFFEVKYRHSKTNFDIYSSITKRKKNLLYNSILYWLNLRDKFDSPWRFDFIGITFDNNKYELRHFEFLNIP